MDRPGIVFVLFSLAPHLMGPHAVKSEIRVQAQRIEGFGMKFFHSVLNVFQGNAAHTAYSSCKISVDHFPGNAHRLKDLGSLIGLDSGDPHFGRDLDNAA